VTDPRLWELLEMVIGDKSIELGYRWQANSEAVFLFRPDGTPALTVWREDSAEGAFERLLSMLEREGWPVERGPRS